MSKKMRKTFHRIFTGFYLSILFLYSVFFTAELSMGQTRPPVKKVFPRWESYTNSGYVNHLVLDSKNRVLWAAGGGVTRFDLDKGTRVKYMKEHGLAGNDVLKLAMHKDVLWITTANGITAHDIEKNTWKSYYKRDGLPDDAVTAVTVDTANHITWFGTWEGYLFSFDHAKKKWDFLPAGIQIPGALISSVAIHPATGSLLVGTWGEGLYTYRPGTRILTKPTVVPPSPLDFISALMVKRDRLWIGTVDNGLWIMNLHANPYEIEKVKDLPDDWITDINAPPGKNRVLVTTRGSGLFIYSTRTGKWKTIAAGTQPALPTDLLNTAAGQGENIFLGSQGKGIIRYNSKDGSLEQYALANEIANNRVSVVTPDLRRNRLWIGTEGNGAAWFEPGSGQWTILNTVNHVLRSDVINCITVDDANDITWIGTDYGMVGYRVGSGKHQWYGLDDGLPGILVYSSGFDHKNKLWAGFYYGSPAIFHPRSRKWEPLEHIPGYVCYEMGIGRADPGMWMASTGGIVHYNFKTRKSTRHWPDSEFRSLLVDEKKGEIWAGSWGEGLFHMEMNSHRQHKIKEFKNLAVLDIKKDPHKDTLWFATSEGVFFLDPGTRTFKHIDATDGLGVNYVLSIGITADSTWFGTWGGGLSRLYK